MASTRAEVISLTAKMSDLEEACSKLRHNHENLPKKVGTEAKTMAAHIVAERDGSLAHYHAVLRSIQEFTRMVDERYAVCTDTLKPLRLSFERGAR